MPCKCKERRAKLLALREKKRAKRQGVQAAALGAVLAVTDKVAQVVGIDNGEVGDGSGSVGGTEADSQGPGSPS